MDLRKAMRRGVPLVLLGAAATVVLRKRLQPLLALPPGDASAVPGPPEAADPSAAIAEHSAAVVATAAIAEQGPAAPHAPETTRTNGLQSTSVADASEQVESRFARRLRRAPVDIVTVVDDLLGAVR